MYDETAAMFDALSSPAFVHHRTYDSSAVSSKAVSGNSDLSKVSSILRNRASSCGSGMQRA